MPIPNFWDDDACEDVYIPTTVDSSIRAILEHRGVPEARIAALLVDLDGPCTLADTELDTLLPCGAATSMNGAHHHFEVRLTRDAHWDGETLKLRGHMPETLLAAMPGRTLRQVVDHDALPDRTILSAESTEEGIRIRVAPDRVHVVTLARAPELTAAASPTRSRMRRAWIDRTSEAQCKSDWSAWIDGNRADAVQAFLRGEAPTIAAHCWGGMTLSPAPLARLGWRRIAGGVRALFAPRAAAAA